jgi:hypothetical protein
MAIIYWIYILGLSLKTVENREFGHNARSATSRFSLAGYSLSQQTERPPSYKLSGHVDISMKYFAERYPEHYIYMSCVTAAIYSWEVKTRS